MKTYFNLENIVSELVIENRSFRDISSILQLDMNYISYVLNKIRTRIIRTSDESNFYLAYKIDHLTNKHYSNRILSGNEITRQTIIDMIIKGEDTYEIIKKNNVNYMYYVSVIRYVYYELYCYGNKDEKKYLSLFRRRIDEIKKRNRTCFNDNVIIEPSDEKLIVQKNNNEIVTLDGKFHQVFELTDKDFKYIVISDTHFGSVFENFDYLKMVYEYAVKNGIKYIFHAGDLIEGDYAEFGRCPYKYKNIMAQIDHVVNDYCYDDSIHNYILFGNHDIHALIEGIDIESELSVRKDFTLLGFRSAYLHLKNEYIGLKHEIARIQNDIVDEQVLISYHGHPHHYRCIYNNRNVIFKSATLSDMRSNNLAIVNRGFFVGSVNYDNDSIGEIEVKFINFDNLSHNYVYRMIMTK